ncbi:pilus assembly protein PilA [Vibrio crassostreae 9CS106]|uniref:pilin n=1 Tax=Vibrio TaxID=662 RepID=UPI000315968F|nr:prepilin-type N-terminal cleavage/methylation domain-containing protein [Vibrio cyclitrophicus]ANP75635.1 pilus assembly protein PilA [Vibrio crassostreae 9CS106]OEE00838.1 pilus assembly protein PilA [Vibrio cyclitrophicus ZF264]
MNNKSKRTNQKGFTLIELMIVVAIIGVLSAIAVPAYKDYVSKSELASGFATLKSIITPAELYIQENGTLTADPTVLGVSAGANSLGVLSTTTGNVVKFTHDNGAVSGAIFTYSRDSAHGWTCKLENHGSNEKPKGCS